jgi:methanogenic corrinoid protein MtbC1
MTDPTIEKLRHSITSFQEEECLQSVTRLLENGYLIRDIMGIINESMVIVGKMFQEGGIYISGLMLATEITKNAMKILSPPSGEELPKKGLVMLGTMEGDIHDLGKNLVAWFLEADGFQVVDLGVDIPPREFLKEILLQEPDIVGISLLLHSSVEPVRRLARLVKDAYFDRPKPPIFVGGSLLGLEGGTPKDVIQDECAWLGVDHVVHDAFETLTLCRSLFEKKKKKPET